MAKKQLPAEFKEFIRLLNSAKVRYVVLGGWAVNLYSNPRATAVIDFFIGIDEKNVQKILTVLAEFGLKNVPHKYFSEKGNVVRMGTPPTKIEILTGEPPESILRSAINPEKESSWRIFPLTLFPKAS